MKLGELIKALESMDQDMIVEHGFSTPHSDRGYYYNLAFTPEPTAKISDMLAYAKSAVGATYEGWKGGENTMDEYTKVHIGEWGECGEEITSTNLRQWALSQRSE